MCSNVAMEPHLQPLTREEFDGASATTDDGARLDIVADGVCGGGGGGSCERTFLMFTFFIPMYIQIVIVVVLQLQYIGNMRRKGERL